METKRAALYVRVSTAEQKKHGLSVDSQIQALTDYCKEHGYSVVNVYNDAGISARKKYKKRPALLQLLDDCQHNKVDIILFTKLDRWFRSVADYYEVQTILDHANVPWRSIWEDYETETSSGVFKVNIMLSVAQSEADRTSERIKAVNEYRKANGCYVGKAPTGYKLNKGDLIKDEAVSDIMDKIFDYYANCYSTIDTVRYSHSLGLPLARETFTRILKNETYCGNAFGYSCEPYITREQYEINLRSVENRRQRKSVVENRTYLFNGICKCKICGRNMSGSARSMKSGNKTYKYKFYRCLGHRNALCSNQRTVSELAIERHLLDNIEAEMNKYIDLVNNNSANQCNKKKIEGLEKRLERVGLRFEMGDISIDEYKEKRTQLLSEMTTLKNQIPLTIPKTLPNNWKSIYTSLDDSHKKAFWQATVGSITLPCDSDNSFGIYF